MTANAPEPEHTQRQLSALAVTVAAMAVALLIIAAGSFFAFDEPFALPEPVFLLVLPVVLLVVTTATAEFLTRAQLSHVPAEATAEDVLPRVRAITILRLALLEAPGVMCLALGFAFGNWLIILAGAVLSAVAVVALAAPHAPLLRYYEKLLNDQGARVRLR